MTDPASQRRPLTIEEYLRDEEIAEFRHEYVAGEIYAMTGGSRRHNRIALNLAARLLAAARGGPCRVYMNDVKLRAAVDVIYYPDLMVACGPEHDDPLVEYEPCLVAEVLSPSTHRTDRREKALVYKAIPGLQSYLLIDQARRRVERHWRDTSGVWQDDEVTHATGTALIRIPCPDLAVTLDEIYERVDWVHMPDQPRQVREPELA